MWGMMEMVDFYDISLFIKTFKGGLINIPVLMIKKSDGDNIKEFLLSGNDSVSKGVSISINFEIVSFFFRF